MPNHLTIRKTISGAATRQCPSSVDHGPAQGAPWHPQPWMFEKNPAIEAWHEAKCVSTWASRFNDTDKCVGYLAGKYRLAEHKEPEAPTLAEFTEDCERFREYVDADFLQDLCSASSQAMRQVWQSRFPSHGAKKH